MRRSVLYRSSAIMLATLGGSVALMGCGTLPPVGDPSNALARGEIASDQINWPARYRPEEATFFVHNQIEIQAPPEVVWDVLLQAETWPSWYEGASSVKVLTSGDGRLGADAVFSWRTMDLDFTSAVKEFVPPFRLSWESRRDSIKGYHAWLIVPVEGGSKLITDESQHGFLASMQGIFIPNQLHRLHDVWLREIKKKSETRGPLISSLGL